MYNEDSRTKNSIRNIFYTVGGQLSKEFLAFIVRTVFIRTLAIEYLGVNGLFTNILSFLSLAEMGVGSALIFAMYKPMAEHDKIKLQMYMSVYKKVYTSIGFFVLGVGFALTPFLNYFMKERPDIPHLELIYILYVLNTGATYFFAYKGSIFNADQRAYVVTNNTTIFTIIQSLVRIVVLVTTHNFIAYLALSIAVVYLQNFNIARKANKAYPFIKERPEEHLPKEEAAALKKNIRALLMHKIGLVVLNSSDNIIISRFIGVLSVGLYSNYSLITNAVKSTFDMIIGAIGTSVGNLCAKEKIEKVYQVHNAILLLNIWIGSFCVICLFNLLNPFITIWLGEDFLFPISTVLAIVISFYIQVTMRAGEMFKTASGLFWYDRYAPVAQCIINVIVSILLAKKYEITGIFIGTSVAMLLTKWWTTPYVLFKHKFHLPLSEYFSRYGAFTGVGTIAFLITTLCSSCIQSSTVVALLGKMIVCIVVPNSVFFCLLFRTKEFQYCLSLFARGPLQRIVKRIQTNGERK